MAANIKHEGNENDGRDIIPLSSGSSVSVFDESEEDDSDIEQNPIKKQRIEAVLPIGFLDPLRPEERLALEKRISSDANHSPLPINSVAKSENRFGSGMKEKREAVGTVHASCKQFWKAGDYKAGNSSASVSQTVGMDHVRVHPKFLHSNATSHKWALGAFAELLDNALDEVCNGATYVHVDVLESKKDHNKMLMVEDNGGGMTPDEMRSCMSLGYSSKSKMANTIGQYGNGFKTSTMRLGADVIVFSRCKEKVGESTTQSIGMLSYTFLRSTGKEDIVVPMVHYEKMGGNWNKLVGSSPDIWERNLGTIVQWSPYESEEDLLRQFDFLKEQGTCIIIYNLWEDEQDVLELDFGTDQHDIQIKGVSRDEKKIQMAKLYPNSRHFLTYRHSLRSYASILYRSLPAGFRIILRGKDVDHHNLIDDMMHKKEVMYKPTVCTDATDQNMFAMVTLGFVKDATHHIDVQGFNVYHKNRLIKPFWRVWNAAGSDGRGVIGVLEANFVEPAHDKQGFERTIVLSRLEARLVVLQKNYWSTNCQCIGYAQRRNLKKSVSPDKECSPSVVATSTPNSVYTVKSTSRIEHRTNAFVNDAISNKVQAVCQNNPSTSRQNPQSNLAAGTIQVKTEELNGVEGCSLPLLNNNSILKLKEENRNLRISLQSAMQNLQCERQAKKLLENQLLEAKQKMDKMDQEQEMFVASFSEERSRRDSEEEKMRTRLKEASETIQALLDKVKLLERRGFFH